MSIVTCKSNKGWFSVKHKRTHRFISKQKGQEQWLSHWTLRNKQLSRTVTLSPALLQSVAHINKAQERPMRNSCSIPYNSHPLILMTHSKQVQINYSEAQKGYIHVTLHMRHPVRPQMHSLMNLDTITADKYQTLHQCIRQLTLNSRKILATMMDTELADAPITPTILSGLAKTGVSPFAQRTSEPSRSMSAWTKVSDCSRAYVSREQVSRMRAPRVTLGSSSGSLLMRSMANSMASNRWMPFSFFSSPQGTPRSPRVCTGKRPPRMMSPSIRTEWAYSVGRSSKRWEKDGNQQQISAVRRKRSLYGAQFRLMRWDTIVILRRSRRSRNPSPLTKMAIVVGGTIHVHT